MVAWSGKMGGSGGDDRAFRVEQIREALEDGSYRVDGAAVAARMVDEAVRTLRTLPPSALRESPLAGGGDQAK